VPDHRGIPESFDFTFAHAAEVVPRFIMGARVLKAEPEMFVQLVTRLRNTIAAFPGTIRTRARPGANLRLRSIRFDPNVLSEMWLRRSSHDRIMMAEYEKTRK
jgi:hypothetical protein